MQSADYSGGEIRPERLPDDQIIAPLDVLGLVRLIWHGKWVIALAVVIMTMIGGYYAFHIAQPRFAATAVLQTNPQAANLRDVSNHWPAPPTDIASLNTQVTILTSDRILEQVIVDLDLMKDPEFNRYLNPVSPLSPNALRTRLRNFFEGTTDTAPDADDIAEKTIQNLRAALSANQPHDTYIFQITARSGDPEKAARLANAAAAAYIAHQIETKEEVASADIQWLSARVDSLRSQLEDQEQAITGRIAQAQIQEETMLDTLSGAVLAADEERLTTQAALASYDRSDASLRQTAEMAQLQDQLTEIDARRARLRTQLANQSQGLVALQQMQRDTDATRVLYQSFLARLQETKVQRGLDYPDSRMIAPAMTGRYIGPRKMLLIEVSAMLGGLLGLALIAAQHMCRTGVYHPDQLRREAGRQVYATLPTAATGTRKRLIRFLRNPANANILRNMRGNLMLSSYGKLPQLIAITSAVAGEGKAGLACTLAYGLSSKGSTLIIDANPNAAPLLSRDKTKTDEPQTDPQLGVDVMHLTNTDALFGTDYIGAFKHDYDHIVLITAPVLDNPETQILIRHVDVTLIAVRWAKTPKALMRSALALCEDATDAPIGLALTKTQPRKMRKMGKIIAPQAPAQMQGA